MSHKHLYDYLSPSLQAHLEEAGDLPSQDRAKLATDMRRTLSSYAAYIPYQLVQKQLANPQPGRIHGAFWEGSMLFADLSGFTRFCDKLSVLGKQGAEEVSSVINQLFTSLVTEIMAYQGDLVAYNGELLKFGGDALTAFFNADTLGPVHAAAATLAAIGMQERMASFAHVETRVGTFRLGLRIGVHSGEVFAAEVGDTSHMELIVTGTDVNRVAIAQKMAVPGEVVISDQTALWLEGARLLPKKPGFYKVLSLSGVTLPPPPEPLPNDDANDIATLENLALQIAALRPYLLRDLPLRYLDDRITELGEFRPVSVLFAHFHDFSTLIPRFGTEAMLAATALNAYYRRVQDIVHQYDGIINKVDMHTYGDKIMALFGAPTAHEDDPLRAVRCAMELEKALREANIEIAGLLLSIASDYIATLQYAEDDSPIILQQRVGINTGTVFAGRVGGVQRHEYTVMGPAVNMAARLMEVANNNTILLSPATRNAVERYITVVEQTPVYVKGVAEPIVPVQVTGEQEMSISSQSASVSRAPLIGRDTEMAFLLAEAKQALRDTGRVLVIVGDVGLGKTRLAEELSRQLVLASVSFEPSNAIPSFQICTGEGQNLKQSIPYITLRTPLRQVLGLNKRQGDTTAESEPESLSFQMQRRVEQLAPEFSHFLPLLGDILGIQLIETPLTRSLSPEQRHHRLQEFVNAIFIGAALHEPLMLFVDDLQWADISSLHVFARLSESATQVPMLLVLCYRSSATIAEPWMKLPHTIRQDLQELSSQQSLDLLHAMLNGSPPPEMLALVERTQGNPFFIEELVRTLVASGTLARNNDGAWHLTCPPDQVAVPSSIEGLITSRLDQLDEPYHEIVQVASIIGQRFQVPILEGVYRKPEMLPYGLQYLQDIDLIISDDPNDQHTYHFRHALLHNVAYESILYSQRRDLHRRVAQRIETLNTGHLDEHLALLTRHYLLAEDWEPAFRYHLEAGIQAKQRYANEEALVLFTTAQDIATRLYQNNGNNDPSPLEDMRPEPGTGSANMSQVVVQTPPPCPIATITLELVQIHEHCGDISMLMGKYDEARTSYQHALTLLNQNSRKHEQCQETYPDLVKANPDCVERCKRIATMIVRMHRLMATVYEQCAEYDSAFEWLERGLSHTRSNDREELASCYLLGASIYQRQGEFNRSLDWARMGLAVARQTGNPSDQSHALLLMGNLWRERGEFSLSIPALEQARALLDQIKDATRLSEVLKNLGDTYHRIGRWQDAVKCYQQSMQISENIGDIRGMARASNNLAVVMVGRDELDFATDLYRYSSEQFRRIGSLLGLALTGYNEAEVMLLQGQARDALHLLRTSITSLENIKARNYLPEAMRLAAEANLALGNIDEAALYGSQSIALASELGMAIEEAVSGRVMGQIAFQRGDFAVASAHLESSRLMLEQLENPYELGRVLYWQARLKQTSGEGEQVAPLLDQAEQIFKNLRARRDLSLVKEMKQTRSE